MMQEAPSAQVLFNRLLVRLRLRHLQLLTAVADNGNLQRAAQRMQLSQPAATQAIAEIERVLELPLFERHARGMRLTPFGDAILPMARSAVRALQTATDAMTRLRDGHEGILRIGMITAAHSWVQATLPAFSAAHPRLLFEVMEGSVDHLLQELLGGALDAVLCRMPSELSPALQYEALRLDQVSIVCDARQAPPHGTAIAWPALQQRLWLVPPPGVGARPAFDALWRPQSPPRLHPITTTSIPLMVELLRNAPEALGVAPRSLIQHFCDWGVVRELQVQLPDGASLHLGHLGVVLPRGGAAKGVRALCKALAAQALPAGQEDPFRSFD